MTGTRSDIAHISASSKDTSVAHLPVLPSMQQATVPIPCPGHQLPICTLFCGCAFAAMKKFSTCRAHLRWRCMFPASRPLFVASIASQTLCCPRNRDFFLPTTANPPTAHSNHLLLSGAAPLPIQWWQPVLVVGCQWRKRASSTVLLCFSVHFLFSDCSPWPCTAPGSRTHRGRFDSWATLSPTQVQRFSQSTVPWSSGV